MVRFSKTILLLLAFHSFCFAQTIQQNSSAIGILGSLEFGPILWKSSDLAVPDFANTFGIKGRLNYGINEMFSAGIAYTIRGLNNLGRVAQQHQHRHKYGCGHRPLC